MALSVHNFAFIRHEQPALAALLAEAEQFVGGDSCCFLLKVRLALELWCHDFADLHGLALALETTLAEKLEILSRQKVFPVDLLQQLLDLRQHANQAVHIQQDQRGRHVTMAPLERPQQIRMLQCLFELVSYTKRFVAPDSELPLWQSYPKQNIRSLVAAALADPTQEGAAQDGWSQERWAQERIARQDNSTQPAAGDAAVQLAQAIHQHLQQHPHSPHVALADLIYWLERGLRFGSVAALQLLSELVFAKVYASVDIAMLDLWLQRFMQQQPSAALDYLAAQLLERQNQPGKAIKKYQKAANAGHHAAIKRLLDYWSSRDKAQLSQYVQLGVQHNEPNALLASMALLLSELRPNEPDAVADSTLKTLKGHIVKARAMALAGFGYIEAMCHHFGVLGYTQDPAKAAALALRSYQKVPSYCKAAFNTFYLLRNAQQLADAIAIAPRALAQVDEKQDAAVLAELEVDIALILLKLHEQKTPVPFVKTPQQLLQSASKRGYIPSSAYLNSQQRTRFKPTTRQVSPMPSWATKLAARGAKVHSHAVRL